MSNLKLWESYLYHLLDEEIFPISPASLKTKVDPNPNDELNEELIEELFGLGKKKEDNQISNKIIDEVNDRIKKDLDKAYICDKYKNNLLKRKCQNEIFSKAYGLGYFYVKQQFPRCKNDEKCIKHLEDALIDLSKGMTAFLDF